MIIKIGEKIRDLRKKANVNQEKFATYLGVTPQAVSKWEVEGCYPDIELLPVIANFFDISIDELMCFDMMKNQEKIDSIIKNAGSERSIKWYNGVMIDTLKSAIQEFPNNYELLYCLARALCFTKSPPATIDEEQRHRNLMESVSICNRILGDCGDDKLRFKSLQILTRAYKSLGLSEKAIETANRLPQARDSRDMVLMDILEEKEKITQIVQNIWLLSDVFEYAIENLANSRYKDHSEERIKLFKKIIAIEEILHEEGDYIYENLRLRAVYYWLAEEYMKIEDCDNALLCMEQFIFHSIKWDLLPETSKYTSIIFDGELCCKYKDFDDMTQTRLGAKKILLTNKIFEPILKNERFMRIMEELEISLRSDNEDTN